jgi:integrative and conjugative element protein (TIGR02256 family)
MSLTTTAAWLREATRTDLLSQAKQYLPNETGGLLLGYRHSRTVIVITDAIGPGPAANHRRTGFDPDSAWQTRQIALRYEAAGRRITYLGDWHTHPGGTTALSRTDRRTLRGIARHSEARCPAPIMAVLADGEPWTIAVWQQAPRSVLRGRLNELPVHSYS